MKGKILNALLLAVIYVATCAATAAGPYFGAGLRLSTGQQSPMRIKAPETVENRVATERNRAEAARKAEDLPSQFRGDENITSLVKHNINIFLMELDAIRNFYIAEKTERERSEAAARAEAAKAAEEKREAEEEALLAGDAPDDGGGPVEAREELEASDEDGPDGDEQNAAEQNAAEQNAAEQNDNDEMPSEDTDGSQDIDAEPAEGDGSEYQNVLPYAAYGMFDALYVIFTEYQRRLLLDMQGDEFDVFIRVVQEVADEILKQQITVNSDTRTIIRNEFRWSSLAENESVLGYEIVNAFLEPNYVVDEEYTRLLRTKTEGEYETVFVQADDIIVEEGERISQEAYAILEDLGMLDTGLAERVLPLAGAFAIIAALLLACALHLSFYRKKASVQRRDALLTASLYLAVLGIVFALGDVPFPFLPILIFPMLISILVDLRVSILMTVCLVTAGYFIVDGTMEYYLFYLISGILICLIAKYTTERNKIFMVGILMALINFTVSCAVSFVVEKNNVLLNWQSVFATAGFTALNGMLTVIFCMGSLPFWEKFFGAVTPVRILELTNPTNALMRKLTIEAPGTYHHSLIVANLAEAAAYDIGANPATTRAGGYYHDIGKIQYPQYFSENIAGENPHDNMDPYNSAQLIMSHVTYGLALAADFRLPQFIKDMINEHHGTTVIHYFYVKAKDEGAGGPVSEDEFRYPFMKPQTRESACVMLADTVEAAVRSMIPRVKSVAEVEDQIRRLIRDKLTDGQLSDSGLSIKDVDTIGQSFFRVLKGLYHERIAYPHFSDEKDKPAAKTTPYARSKGRA